MLALELEDRIKTVSTVALDVVIRGCIVGSRPIEPLLSEAARSRSSNPRRVWVSSVPILFDERVRRRMGLAVIL